MGIKVEPKRHFRHFCFCLGLRLGTNIISALWVVSGLVLSIIYVVAITRGASMDAYHHNLTTAHILCLLLGICIGIFGLCASAIKFTVKSVKFYRGVVWVAQVGIWVVLCSVRIVLSLTTGKDYYSWCHARCKEQGSADGACSDRCLRSLHIGILIMFIEITFTVAFNIYSALIITAYAKQVVQKRQTVRLTKRDSLASTLPYHFPQSRTNSLRAPESVNLEVRELKTNFFPSPRASLLPTTKSVKKSRVPSIYHPDYTAPYNAPFKKHSRNSRQNREAPPVDTARRFQFWAGDEEAGGNMGTMTTTTMTRNDDRLSGMVFDTYNSETGTELDKESIRSPVIIVSPASTLSKDYEMPSSWEAQEELLGVEDITASLRR